MRVQARLLCRSGKSEGNVQILIYHEKKQKEVSLGYKLPISHWNKNRELATGDQYKMLNVRIQYLINNIEKAIIMREVRDIPVQLDNIVNDVFKTNRV